MSDTVPIPADSVVAIDPGLSGAIAVFSDDGKLLVLEDMPTLKTGTGNKREIDVDGVIGMLPIGCRVVIERQQAMPKQGVSSTFKTGYGYGLLLGTIQALAFRHEIVNPATWARAVKRPAGSGKDWCIAEARRRYPDWKSKFLKSKDGRADAVMIGIHALDMVSADPPPPETDAQDTKVVDVVIPDW